MKRLIPNAVFFLSMFWMFSCVAYYDANDFWFFDYQWDYAFCCGFACTAITYGMCKLCGNWAHKIDKVK